MIKVLPKAVLDKAIHSEISGIVNITFLKKDILEILQNGDLSDFAILGGDVMKLDEEKNVYGPTYDSWYVSKRKTGESFKDFCQRCSNEAIRYIEKYPDTNGIVFMPVIENEITAGM